MGRRPASPLPRLIPWLALLGILGIFVALRARGIGHLLMWDEAMDLASVRAWVTSSRDAFSNAFWAHPPLFSLLLARLDPLWAGFAERAEGLSILVQAVNLGLLFVLNRRLFGPAVALLSCLALACLPGAVFFDVWIKRDHLVVTFGLLALLALDRQRGLACGLLLGFALLTKESALFYLAAVLALVPMAFAKGGRLKNALAIPAVAAAASVWWYALFSIMSGTYLRFALGRETALSGWNQPWTYYLSRTWVDLGPAALAILAAGLAAWLVDRRRVSSGAATPSPPLLNALRFWPFALLIPAYLYLGLARGKAPWLTMGLYPAWATLVGISAQAVLKSVTNRIAPARGQAGTDPLPASAGGDWRERLVPVAVTTVLLLGLLLPAWRSNHAAGQLELGFGQQWGAAASHEAATALNRLVQPGQRVLITPFWYWGDDPIPSPCPIFAWYLNDMPVMLQSFHMTPEELVATVRTNRISWALLSPPPGTGEVSLLQPLVTAHGLVPQGLTGAVIFRTDGLWKDAPTGSPIGP